MIKLHTFCGTEYFLNPTHIVRLQGFISAAGGKTTQVGMSDGRWEEAVETPEQIMNAIGDAVIQTANVPTEK